MDEAKAQELLKSYAASINDYRSYLYVRIADCRKQLEKERESAIRSIEFDEYPESHRKNLIELRVQVATYENALNALESNLGEATPEGAGGE